QKKFMLIWQRRILVLLFHQRLKASISTIPIWINIDCLRRCLINLTFMNKIFQVDTEIEDLHPFLALLKKTCDAKIEFPHINDANESQFQRHKDGTFYSTDFNSLSILIITISGTATSLVAFLTALITYKKEKRKSDDKKKDNNITISYRKRTI